MSQQVSKINIRFYIFLIVLNLSSFLLLLLWIWRYLHGGCTPSKLLNFYGVLDAQITIVAPINNVFDLYTFDVSVTLFFVIISLLCIVYIFLRKWLFAYAFLFIYSFFILLLSTFIQLNSCNLLHSWKSTTSLALGTNILSIYLKSRNQTENQNFDRKSLLVMEMISVMTCFVNTFGFGLI
jgi:hypothetical protein